MKKKKDTYEHKKVKVELILRNGQVIELKPGSVTHPYLLFKDVVKAVEGSGIFNKYYKNDNSLIRLRDVSFVSIKLRK